MERKHESHKWFIEPLDAKTNEILAKNQEFLSEEQIIDGIHCADGKPHKLWGCQRFDFIAKMFKSKAQLATVFRVWHQEGNGQIRLWVFTSRRTKG